MSSRFLRVEIVKAASGSSATCLSAYIARDTRQDATGARFNFSHRAEELEGKGLLLPNDAPDWAVDPGRLWREAERAEQTIDRKTGELRWKTGGQVAKHFVIALPRELSPDQRQEMLMAFVVNEICPQKHGVAVEWAVHKDENNPHAHLLISTRNLNGDGFGQKARSMNPEFASKNGRHFVGEGDNWDVRWAAFQKRFFVGLGVDFEVPDRRFHPDTHYPRGQLSKTETVSRRQVIDLQNQAAALRRLRDPVEMLVRLTANKAIFTERDVRQALNKADLEADDRAILERKVLEHPDVVTLVGPLGDAIGWTTRQVRSEEKKIFELAGNIALSSTNRTFNRHLRRNEFQNSDLTFEQRQAALYLTEGRQIAFLVGRAGTGKSHTLNVVRQKYESDGFRVIGLAPTNSVVADLRKDGYRRASTLHRELWKLDQDPTRWDRHTVVIVDEAAMIDNSMMLKLLWRAQRYGVRLILAGDDRQLLSVARGGMFGSLVDVHGSAVLRTVQRQNEDYQAAASELFARREILGALQAYQSHDRIIWCDSLDDARTRAVAAQATTSGPSFLYASTNAEVEKLNQAEQARRRADLEAAGKKILALNFTTVRGTVSIAQGERVQFHRSDRKLGIATSEFGTVISVSEDWMKVVKDDGSIVEFDPLNFNQWGLGYSGTAYKGQGKTQLKTAAVYDNPYAWDARAAYVIGTRHREDYHLFVPRTLASNLYVLTDQIMLRRPDQGASIRFKTQDEFLHFNGEVVKKDQKIVQSLSERSTQSHENIFSSPDPTGDFKI